MAGDPQLDRPLQLWVNWGGIAIARGQEEEGPGISGLKSVEWLWKGSLAWHQPDLGVALPPGFREVAACLTRDPPSLAPTWGPSRDKAAHYYGRAHGGNSVHHLDSTRWGHQGYLCRHCDCFSGEVGPQESLHGSQSPRALCWRTSPTSNKWWWWMGHLTTEWLWCFLPKYFKTVYI